MHRDLAPEGWKKNNFDNKPQILPWKHDEITRQIRQFDLESEPSLLSAINYIHAAWAALFSHTKGD